MAKQNKMAVYADLENVEKFFEITEEGSQSVLEQLTKNNFAVLCPQSVEERQYIDDLADALLLGATLYELRTTYAKQVLFAALCSYQAFAEQLRKTADMYDQHKTKQKADEKQEAKFDILRDAYRDMADVVTAIGAEFGNMAPVEATQLTERNVNFSGKRRKDRRNLTFTNGQIRDFAVQIYQISHRMMYSHKPEHALSPLSEKLLFPVHFEGFWG